LILGLIVLHRISASTEGVIYLSVPIVFPDGAYVVETPLRIRENAYPTPFPSIG
jgi:hypothetical protein